MEWLRLTTALKSAVLAFLFGGLALTEAETALLSADSGFILLATVDGF